MSAVRKTRNQPSAGSSDSDAFLGVARSARGLVWRERLAGADINRATMISQRHGLPELLGRVIAARGIGVDDTPVFLDPTLKALMPDPIGES